MNESIVFASLIGLLFISGCVLLPQEILNESAAGNLTLAASATNTPSDDTDTTSDADADADDIADADITFDSCASVSCADKCEGTTSFHSGTCSAGICSYSETTNSETCGYVEPSFAGLGFNSSFKKCKYFERFTEYELFVSVKNNATSRATKENASIGLVMDSIDFTDVQPLPRIYEVNEYFWAGEASSDREGDDLSYNSFDFKVPNQFEFKSNAGYVFYYCENSDASAPCDASNGKLLLSGTTAGCTIIGR